MRKFIALILSLALCLCLSSALADQLQAITVTGTGETLVTADTAVVTLGVNIRKTAAPDAQSEANKAIAAIRAALTGAGFPEEDVSTGYVNLYAVYDYSKEVEQIIAYNAASSLAIRVTDMSRVGEVIDLAFGAGANTLEGVTFSVSDDSAARAESLKAAYADAKQKADILAEASGQQIELLSIQENSVYSYDSGVNNFSRKTYGAEEYDAASPTVVRAAKICVTAGVTVTFAIVH